MEGDRQKGPKKPELKIVEEEPVHRLQAEKPGSGPARKKASLRRSQEKAAIVRDLSGESEQTPVVKSQALESEPQSPAEPLRIPPALVVLVGGGFLLLLALGIFLSLGGRNRDRLHRDQSAARESLSNAEKEKEDAREIVNSITTALEKFTSAKTIEEKLAVSRHPDRVEPLMRKYYAENPLEPIEGVTLVNQSNLSILNHSFLVLTGSFKDQPSKIYLAEVDNEQKVTIDWESDVCYQPVDISEFIRNRVTTPTTLRVLSVPDNFYVYEFADSDKYQCLKLHFRDSEEYLFGYVERNTEASNQLARQFQASRTPNGYNPEPAMLTVRFLEDGNSERGVLIEDFIAPRWAYIDEFEDEE